MINKGILLALFCASSLVYANEPKRYEIQMPAVGQTVPVDLEKIKEVDDHFKKSFNQFLEDLKKEQAKVEQMQPLFNQIAKQVVESAYQKMYFRTKLPLYDKEKPLVERVELPLGSQHPTGKKIIFFGVVDTKSTFKMSKYVSSIPREESPVGFCVDYESEEQIMRFVDNSGQKMVFSAVLNDDLAQEFGVKYYPCIITIVDEKVCEFQYGL